MPNKPNSNLLIIEAQNSSKNIVRDRIRKKIKNIAMHLGKSIKSVEVIQARIMFSKETKPLSSLDGLSGSFRIRILNSKKDNFNLKIDKVNVITEKYRVTGKILGENILSEEALIRMDVIFFSSDIADGAKIKFQLPLKKVDNFESLVRHIDLTGSFFTRNLRLPNKIANSHIPTLEMRFKLRKGMASYNFSAVCPKGYAQITKFTEGVITFKGTGSLNFKKENHITLGLNPHFRVKDCESPDYFKWLNVLFKLKVFKEQNFITTNVHGTASLILDYFLPTKEFSGQGTINIQDLILLIPVKNTKRNPREIQILYITDNQTTLSWKNKKLTFKTDVRISEGDISSHGTIDFTETDKKKGPWVDSYFKVDRFNLDTIKKFSEGPIYATSGTLAADIKVKGFISDIKHMFLEGSIIGENLKLDVR